jgi:predicted Zn-dependent protease
MGPWKVYFNGVITVDDDGTTMAFTCCHQKKKPETHYKPDRRLQSWKTHPSPAEYIARAPKTLSKIIELHEAYADIALFIADHAAIYVNLGLAKSQTNEDTRSEAPCQSVCKKQRRRQGCIIGLHPQPTTRCGAKVLDGPQA